MKKFILLFLAGYVFDAALAGIVAVPLYFNPTTTLLHEAFSNAYYAELILWAGFASVLLSTLLQVLV